MSKLLIFMMFVTIGLTTGATNSLSSLMELPPFERAVRIIKFYETLHINKGTVIGYGHVIQKGEPYKKGVNLTEKQADALLRYDLTKLCKIFEKYGSSALLLACLSYNCGPQKVLNSELIKKIAAGETDIAADYLSFCHYRGKPHPGIRRRRYIEYLLLSDIDTNK